MRRIAVVVSGVVILLSSEFVASYVRYRGRWQTSRGASMIANRLDGIPKYEYSPTRHFRLVPGSKTYSQHFDLGQLIEFSINSRGMRGPEMEPKKPEGEIRIGWFGDSFIEGVGLEERYTMVRRLETLLDLCCPDARFKVLNFGTSGYSLEQHYLRYLEDAQDLDLDVVICTHYDNDMSELSSNRLVEHVNGKLIWSRGLRSNRGMFRRLNLCELYEDLVLHPASHSTNFFGFETDGSGQIQDEGKATIELYSNVLKAFNNQVVNDGSKFVSVVLRNKATLFAANDTKAAVKSLTYNNIVCRIHDFHQISYLDLVGTTKPLDLEFQKSMYFFNDNHLNEVGNLYVALQVMTLMGAKLGLKLEPVPESTVKSMANPAYDASGAIYGHESDKAHDAMIAALGTRLKDGMSKVLFGRGVLKLTRLAKSRQSSSMVCMAIVDGDSENDVRQFVKRYLNTDGAHVSWHVNDDATLFWNDFSRPIIYYADQYATVKTDQGNVMDIYFHRDGTSVKFRLHD